MLTRSPCADMRSPPAQPCGSERASRPVQWRTGQIVRGRESEDVRIEPRCGKGSCGLLMSRATLLGASGDPANCESVLDGALPWGISVRALLALLAPQPSVRHALSPLSNVNADVGVGGRRGDRSLSVWGDTQEPEGRKHSLSPRATSSCLPGAPVRPLARGGGSLSPASPRPPLLRF